MPKQHIVDPPSVATMAVDGDAITCIAAGPGGRVFAGDANGTVRCYARAAASGAPAHERSSSEREAESPAGDSEAVALQWATRATTRGAILVRPMRHGARWVCLSTIAAYACLSIPPVRIE